MHTRKIVAWCLNIGYVAHYVSLGTHIYYWEYWDTQSMPGAPAVNIPFIISIVVPIIGAQFQGAAEKAVMKANPKRFPPTFDEYLAKAKADYAEDLRTGKASRFECGIGFIKHVLAAQAQMKHDQEEFMALSGLQSNNMAGILITRDGGPKHMASKGSSALGSAPPTSQQAQSASAAAGLHRASPSKLAEGSSSQPAEGCSSQPAEGSSSQPAEGSSSQPAEGSSFLELDTRGDGDGDDGGYGVGVGVGGGGGEDVAFTALHEGYVDGYIDGKAAGFGSVDGSAVGAGSTSGARISRSHLAGSTSGDVPLHLQVGCDDPQRMTTGESAAPAAVLVPPDVLVPPLLPPLGVLAPAGTAAVCTGRRTVYAFSPGPIGTTGRGRTPPMVLSARQPVGAVVRLPGKGALPPAVQAVQAAATAIPASAASDCSAAAWPDLACAPATTAAAASGCRMPAAKDEGHAPRDAPRDARASRASVRWDHGDWNEEAVTGRTPCPGGRRAQEDAVPGRTPCPGGRRAQEDAVPGRTPCPGGRRAREDAVPRMSSAAAWPELACTPAAAAPTASLRQRRLTAERAASSEAPPPPSSSSAVARPSLPSPAVLRPAVLSPVAVLSPALTPATVARRDERESTTALRAARRDERESGTASRDAPTIGSADDRAALNAALRPRRPELAQRDAQLAQRDAPAQAPARKRAHVRSIKLSPEHPSIYYL